MPLARLIPFAAVTFVLACMASIGLPGFSGFIAELQVLIGTWRSFPWAAWIAGLGILIGVAFTWRALQSAFLGEAGASAAEQSLPSVTVPERLGASVLIAATIAAGLYPRFLLNLIQPTLNSPLFEGLRRGMWR
jgi:NADH-quinone oxidoreductase subunit M